ncbi:hypothetical membrane protein [Aquimarina amphilecti]|uniref:Hypothetical membrane protein n=1 Tax=Aquimarina amphilecti TaxID=1038014 RepID=A0A1H7M8J0_AQUAM|nr:DUF998 domain-containing protein [Aquimarina amphilecti]SEL07442.1 hypothetical membrane protein [Aquimarina amphilecti]
MKGYRKKQYKDHPFLCGLYITLIVIAFILPFFSDPEYSISKHTLYELGAQKTPYNWIMNFVLILLGLISFVNGFRILQKQRVQLLILLVFCLSLVLSAIFLSAPIDRKLVFDSFQNEIHSVFSIITGISFCAYSLVISFAARWRSQKLMALFVGIITLIGSFLMFIHSDYRGIYQRGIFMITFGWILYSFKYYEYVYAKKEYFKLIKENQK